ncbi:hypothetical protein [Aliikangiella sp. G2MR2-5]|uniref:hypothetical protein n=1 Tax=Aliikangiella sp. G2MR2-5 TaxID=2788943 RepID=UPI001AEEB6A2|nr:hypothetical protein [Aliikangiella sp. G2MR2-5]
MSDYLWQWPLIDGPDQFEPWESSRPELVNFGLGDSASDNLISVLNKSGIDETQFRRMVEGVIEILWGSFWGAAEHELSMKALEAVLLTSNVSELPALTPFKFSLFTDNHGWGQKLTLEDRNFWRNCYKVS